MTLARPPSPTGERYSLPASSAAGALQETAISLPAPGDGTPVPSLCRPSRQRRHCPDNPASARYGRRRHIFRAACSRRTAGLLHPGLSRTAAAPRHRTGTGQHRERPLADSDTCLRASA
jgi:hypothetical protein